MHGQIVTTRPPLASAFFVPVGAARNPSPPIAFRRFLALPAARTLLRDGAPVNIGGRAFDLLLVLLRARGTIVSKHEIVREVWPSTFVDEGNLRFQMAMLRKALGDDRDLIKTVTGRGYLLIDERGLSTSLASAASAIGASSISGSEEFTITSERFDDRLGQDAPNDWCGQTDNPCSR